jgi:hypothetical protein
MAFEHLELDHLECLPRSLVQLTWSTENGDHIFRIPRLPHLKSLVWTGPLDVRQLGKFGALESLSIAPSSVGGCSRTVRLDGIEEAAPGLQILRMRCASLGILGGIAHTMTELQELSLVNIEILNFGLAPLKYLPNLKKLTLSESVRIGCETVDVHALGISHFQSLKELDISMLDTSQNDAIHHPFFDHLTSSWEDLLRDVFRGALPPILDTIVVSDEQVHLLEGLNIESKQEVKTDEYSSKWIIKLKNT